MLSSACCIPGILGARNAVPCSLETSHLVRKVNDKQLKQMKTFTLSRPRQRVATGLCSMVLGSEGRPLTCREAEIWIMREPAISSFLCFFSPFTEAYRFIPAWCICSLYGPIIEANGTLYSSLSPGIYQTADGLIFLICLHFLPIEKSLIIMYFRRLCGAFHCPLLLPLHTIHVLASNIGLAIFAFHPFPKCQPRLLQ